MPFVALAKKGYIEYSDIVHYVYIIRSVSAAEQVYVGITLDLKKRLQSHNEGANKHTTKFKPWKFIWFCAFPTKTKAVAFEKYLKTSSGVAFRRKRLV